MVVGDATPPGRAYPAAHNGPTIGRAGPGSAP